VGRLLLGHPLGYQLAVLACGALSFAAVVFSVPGGALLTVAGGFLFGGIFGTVITQVAATTGAGAVFLAARTSLGAGLADRAGPGLGRFARGFRRNGFGYLLALRLVPLMPFWLANVAPALLGMRLLPYLLATFLGILPGTIAFAWVGSGLDSLIEAQELADPGCTARGACSIDPAALVTGDIILACVGLGILALLPLVVQRLRARRAGSGTGAV